MKLFTIGFTKTTAENFLRRLDDAGVRKVLDVRLNNSSQLAGFAKRDDLKFFLKRVSKINCKEPLEIDYEERKELAPTKGLIDSYRKKQIDWPIYEKRFIDLISNRRIEKSISSIDVDNACLLCSEDKPHRCHRRLVAEYLKKKWGELEIVHL